MTSIRRHRSIALAGTALLMLSALPGCSKQNESDTLSDVGGEGESRPSQSKGASPGGGGGADGFSSFQSGITDNPTRDQAANSAPGPQYQTPQNQAPPTSMSPAGGAPRPSVVPPAPVMVPPPVAQQETEPTPVSGTAQRGLTEVARMPVSTFSVDVDTASYARARSTILSGGTPDPSSVRVEEMVNYFRYDLPQPRDPSRPFSVLTDVVRSPWNADSLVLRVALRGYDVARANRLPANLVFLIDVSGSMGPDDRLPLVKRALTSLVDQLGPQDRVSIVTYAGTSGLALAATGDHDAIKEAIEGLTAGGSTAGADGLRTAYQQARSAFLPNGINRVLIASDGDFNVGESDTGSLKALITEQRKSGITLSTLAVGESAGGDGNLETIADAGDGNSAFLGSDAEARKVLHDEITSTLQTIAKDVKAQVEFNPDVISSYRLIGYENRRLAERDFDDDTVDAGDIGAGHQVTALYEIKPAARLSSGLAARRRYAANRSAPEDVGMAGIGGEALYVKLRYKLPQGGQSMLIQQPVPVSTLAAAQAPKDDTAFALAVASFGQYLANTPGIGSFGPADMQRLAGTQSDRARLEFISLLGNLPGGTRIAAPPADAETFDSATVERGSGPMDVLAWLALVSGLAAAAWYWLHGRGPKSPKTSPETSTTPEMEKTTGERLTRTIGLARSESTDPQTDRALSVLENVGERARIAAGSDPDIAVEVKAIIERHLPDYVDEYIQGRRRATAARAGELEEALRRTVEMLTDRLRRLLDSQSRRDVDRLGDHERFLAGRHLPDPAE